MRRWIVLLGCLVPGCGCESNPAGDVDGSVVVDGAVVDAEPRADSHIADASQSDDAMPCTNGGGGALSAALPTEGYLTATGSAIDLACVVSGGVGPYTCYFYAGPGQGTAPAGVVQDSADPTGCTLSGGINPAFGDLPGTYGFIMVVEDANADAVEVPIAYVGADCDTATVSLSPASAPVRSETAGAAYSWQLTATDVDGVNGMTCEPCFNMSILTRSPLALSLDLDCSEPGDICSDCGAGCITGTCPGVHTLVRDIEVRGHSPLRTGAAGWATVELAARYSGASLDPCGSKSWSCHLEVFERD